MVKANNKSYWISNISNRNVSLADLNLTIKAYSSINLMSSHYYYTEEQLNNSTLFGSIYNKRDKIFVRKVAPIIEKNKIHCLNDTTIPSRQRSTYKIEYQEYEELNMTDEQFADENTDMIDNDELKK